MTDISAHPVLAGFSMPLLIIAIVFLITVAVFYKLLSVRLTQIRTDHKGEKLSLGDYVGMMWGELFSLGLIIVVLIILWQNLSPDSPRNTFHTLPEKAAGQKKN